MLLARFQSSGKGFLAVLMGVGAALLPLPAFVMLLGSSLLGTAFLMEPALALIVMLSVAPLKTLIETESPVQLPLDIGQIALFVFIGIWALRRIADRETQFYFPKILLVGIGYFVLMVSFSLWTAYSPSAFVTEMLKWIQIGLLVFIVANIQRWHWILFGVVLSAALQAIIGLWEFQGGSGAAHLWILDYHYFRAFGTFGQPNPFGAFMGMVLPLALATAGGYGWAALFPIKGKEEFKALPANQKWEENFALAMLYGGMGVFIFAALLASWSRGAWLGFLSAGVVMVFLFPQRRIHGILALAVGGMLVGGLWMGGLLPASLTQRLTSFREDFIGFRDVRGAVISDENFAVLERLSHWQSAIEMANANPMLGVGFGNYETAYREFALANWQNPLGHAHNYYLNLLAETGIVGFHAYFIMWGLIIRQNWRLLHKSLSWQQRGVAVGLMGVWTHISVHSFLDKLYVNNLFLHLGVMLGILAALHFQEQVVDNPQDSDTNREPD